MPGFKRKRTHADEFADVVDIAPRDVDPEEEAQDVSDDSDASSEAGKDEEAARGHYQAVGKSRLRKADDVTLGPQYAGSRVSRNGALTAHSEHDPFEDPGSSTDDGSDGNMDEDEQVDEESDDEAEDGVFSAEDDDVSDQTAMTDEDSVDDDDDDGASAMPRAGQFQTSKTDDDVRRIFHDGQKTITKSVTQAVQADATKGRAVKRQRQAFDALLNTRIKLQQGLIASNTLASVDPAPSTADEDIDLESCEKSLVELWKALDQFRLELEAARSSTSSSRPCVKDPSADTLDTMWTHMQKTDATARPHRDSTMNKWASKTEATSTRPAESRLKQDAPRDFAADVLHGQLSLSNMSRLVQRTQLARSCAPAQSQAGTSETAQIYDDADFYGVLLKELLEQRHVDAAERVATDAAAEQWQAARGARTKRRVDTKASKGRKIRYTVHEKLQNFMAPEDRRAWGDRQIDELFGSLLGRTMALEEAMGREELVDDADGEEEALRLFRN